MNLFISPVWVFCLKQPQWNSNEESRAWLSKKQDDLQRVQTRLKPSCNKTAAHPPIHGDQHPSDMLSLYESGVNWCIWVVCVCVCHDNIEFTCLKLPPSQTRLKCASKHVMGETDTLMQQAQQDNNIQDFICAQHLKQGSKCHKKEYVQVKRHNALESGN